MGYKGWVTIDYGQNSGEKINPIKGVYTFKIPNNGILKIANKEPDYNWVHVEYYYIDSSGNKIKKLDVTNEVFGSNNSLQNGVLASNFFVGSIDDFNKSN